MRDPVVATETAGLMTDGSVASGVPVVPRNPPLKALIGVACRTPFSWTRLAMIIWGLGAVAPLMTTFCVPVFAPIPDSTR
jgi:hypothetical protein